MAEDTQQSTPPTTKADKDSPASTNEDTSNKLTLPQSVPTDSPDQTPSNQVATQSTSGFMNSSQSGLPELWKAIKEDIKLPNLVLIILGAILLIFSPDRGWRFDIPCIGWTLAYRGWLGVGFFLIAIISLCKDKSK